MLYAIFLNYMKLFLAFLHFSPHCYADCGYAACRYLRCRGTFFSGVMYIEDKDCHCAKEREETKKKIF
jgi:hypothetical protein